MSIKSLFESTELILLTAIVFPLLFVINVTSMKTWIEIILGIVMFLSIRPFFKQKLGVIEIQKEWKGVVTSLVINYVLLSGIYLLVALVFFPFSSDYFIGYILLAIVPPAVSIVPLCYLTKCDIKIADAALVLGYLIGLVVIPISLYLIFGRSFDFMLLSRSLFMLIVLPMIMAYLTRNVHNRIFDYTKIITNILIGLIVFIVVSLNRSTLLNISDINIMHIFMINIFVVFTLGLLMYFISRKFVPEMDAIDYSLYATQKNEATGLAIALIMFTDNAAIPLIVALVVQFVYFIIFERFIISKSNQ